MRLLEKRIYNWLEYVEVCSLDIPLSPHGDLDLDHVEGIKRWSERCSREATPPLEDSDLDFHEVWDDDQGEFDRHSSCGSWGWSIGVEKAEGDEDGEDNDDDDDEIEYLDDRCTRIVKRVRGCWRRVKRWSKEKVDVVRWR